MQAKRLRWLILASLVAPLWAPATVRAVHPAYVLVPEARDTDVSPWRLDLQMRTDVPVGVGGRVVLETPFRIQVATGAGYMPASYVSIVNDLMMRTGAYGKTTGKVLGESMAGSVSWRLDVGWRPFAAYGFYVTGGYGLLFLDGRVGVADVQRLTGTKLSSQAREVLAGRTYGVKALIHLVSAEIGWRFEYERLVMVLCVGFAGGVAARANVGLNAVSWADEGDILPAAATPVVRDYLERRLRTSVYLPYLGLSLGYRAW